MQKHNKVQYLFIKDKVEQEEIKLQYCPKEVIWSMYLQSQSKAGHPVSSVVSQWDSTLQYHMTTLTKHNQTWKHQQYNVPLQECVDACTNNEQTNNKQRSIITLDWKQWNPNMYVKLLTKGIKKFWFTPGVLWCSNGNHNFIVISDYYFILWSWMSQSHRHDGLTQAWMQINQETSTVSSTSTALGHRATKLLSYWAAKLRGTAPLSHCAKRIQAGCWETSFRELSFLLLMVVIFLCCGIVVMMMMLSSGCYIHCCQLLLKKFYYICWNVF